ncbi:MAG: hypothetical protein J6W75_02555 [Bacteroidaceae bacterium]|nr:hypothetical protein [Bacteroidaceae bacterium]
MKNDNDLFRQALQRQNERAAGMRMPADMEQRVMKHIRPKSGIRRWLYPLPAIAVAASLLLLLVFNSKQKTKQQSVIAEEMTVPERSIPETPRAIIPKEKIEQTCLAQAQVQSSVKRKEPRKQMIEETQPDMAPVENVQIKREPPSEEEEPFISADKQALVDLYLAEEILQVAYELQAQREAIRAYATSLTGEEMPKQLIAF